MGQWADIAGTPSNKPTWVIRSKTKARQLRRLKQGGCKYNEAVW